MNWRGKVLRTMGDVMAAALEIKTKDQAKRFFWTYLESCPDLDEERAMGNLRFGYLRFLDCEDPDGSKYKRYMELFTWK